MSEETVRRIKLHWWILAGMVLGAVVGALVHAVYAPDLTGLGPREARQALDDAIHATAFYRAFDGVASLFLNLLKMVVIPLVFFSLISGLIGMGNLSQLGRMGARTFLLYLLTTTLAILTGLAVVNLLKPGRGLSFPVQADDVGAEVPDSFWEVLVGMVPSNVVQAAANFDLLGVIVFTIFFGVFLLTLSGPRRDTLVSFVEGAAEIMMRMTGFVISLAPIGIAALIAAMVSSTGLSIFLDMRWYVLAVGAALAIHVLVTLPLLIYFFTRRSPYRFLQAMSPALLTGFSTASSSGTLGVTMKHAEENAGISNRIASFVLPLGATVNMDGTALYEIVSVLFIAQVHATADPNFTLTFAQQLLIVFLGLTVSIGAAGIPHAGLVMMVIILQAVGLPVGYTALIWAVDRPLDMCRTAVNIASDSTVCLLVAHSQGEVHTPGTPQPDPRPGSG